MEHGKVIFLYEISSGYIYQALAMVYGMMAAAIEAEITDSGTIFRKIGK